MIAAPFTGSLSTAVQVQTGSGQWTNGVRAFTRAAPALNKIVPFVRPVAPLVKGALLAKGALLLGAAAVGVGIGLLINKAFQNWFPKKPAGPAPEFEDRVIERDFGRLVNVSYEYESVISSYKAKGCKPGSPVSTFGERVELFGFNTNAVAYRLTEKMAALNYVCPGDGETNIQKIHTLRFEIKTKADGDWITVATSVGDQGTQVSSSRQTVTPVKFFTRTIKFDVENKPYPHPANPPEPEPDPLPEVLPEVAPTRVLPKTPVIAPPIPAPGAPVPQTEPLPETAPLPGKIPTQVPVRTAPAVAPQQKPQGVPMNGSGKWPWQKPPANKIVKYTPPNQHIVGNNTPVFPGGVRPTLPGIAAEVGRVEDKLNKLLNPTSPSPGDLFSLINLLSQFLEPQAADATYKLQSICECEQDCDDPDKQCEEEQFSAAVPGGHYLVAIGARLDVIQEELQLLKNWKQPVCREKVCLEGDFRTISFRSDEVSPYGKSRLRKRFRYRSTSSIGLAGVVDHWKDFTFNAGPVCVQHAGASWGTPQVWAASIDEGKRVIHHAAREAGIDTNQNGRWIISGSNSSRIGVPGTMRVDTKGGYYWITERDGSNQRPHVVAT